MINCINESDHKNNNNEFKAKDLQIETEKEDINISIQNFDDLTPKKLDSEKESEKK